MYELRDAGTQENGEIDLFGYILGVVWPDLGQLMYVLNRGLSVEKGLSALKHLTHVTPGFLDRSGIRRLTANHCWKMATTIG